MRCKLILVLIYHTWSSTWKVLGYNCNRIYDVAWTIAETSFNINVIKVDDKYGFWKGKKNHN